MTTTRFSLKHGVRLGGLMLACLLWVVSASAATRTWTGTTDSDWTKASNWGGIVPMAGDTANIPGGLTNYPIITSSISIHAVNINSAGSGARLTVNSGGTLNVGGLTVNPNGTLTVNGGTILSAGTLTDNGSVSISSGSIHLASAIGTAPSDDIVIGAGATFTQSGGSVDTKDFTNAPGPPAGTYNQSGGVFRMYHDFKNSGAFNATGGTVEFNANAGGGSFPSPLGTTQFFNVVMNADPHFDNNTVSFGVAGDWTTNVALDLSGKPITATFNGTGAQTIGGSASTVFASLVVNKPTGTTVTLAQNQTTNNGSVNVMSGTFDLSTFTLNGAAKTDSITVASGATLRIGGTNSFPSNYTTHSLGATSTVEYYGTNQVVTAENYGHLVLSGSGIKTMPATPLTTQGNFTMAGTASATAAAAMTVNGNFTLGAGTTFGAGSFSHSVKGNFTNSGTFNAGASTFTFNGTSAQTIGGSNSTTFNSLTINNASGVSLSGVDTTVNNTLTFTSGNIVTGANSVKIAPGGNVSRTSGHVVGYLQKYFATGAPSANFEVGSATAYTPVNISFASVSVAGNLIASTTTGDHPSIGSSNINAAKTANRYWTVTNSGIVFTSYSITLNFVAADLDAGANASRFSVGKYNSTWTYPTLGTITSTSAQATGITSFSDFLVGEGGPPLISLVKSANASGSALPGTDVTYTVSFTNSGASAALNVVLMDPIPANTDFKISSEAHDLGSTGLGVTVGYSNDGGASWTYTPVSGGGNAPAGYDRNVTNIRWAFAGNLTQNSPNNNGSVSFTTRIR
jgi:fibronectin-binding autotransporter adhesin